MKKYIYMAVAAIAALCSCSSDNDPIVGETGKQALTFTASMEGSATRATYDGTNKCASWEEGDQISINGKTYNAQSAGLTTTFKAATDGQEAEGDTYNAYFACTYDGTTATLPAQVSETWADGKFNMPMYATSTTTNLQFHNLCGVLKITVKSDQIAAVKAIKVSSATMAVSGAFSVTSDAAVLSEPNTIANTLTVTYSDAVSTTAEGKVFYVAVPAQTYQELKIELDADGNGFTKSMTTKSATDITVARNKIYPITFADNAASATTGTAKATIGGSEVDVNWVQLWENGPKFAEYNVGVTDGKAESYGGYYCWGSRIDKDSNGAYKSGTDALTGTDDTATNLWGNNWRMPTRAELDGLLANCDVAWTTVNGVNGRKFTGKDDYKDNSVFLPAAGSCGFGSVIEQGYYGYYWSSTPLGSSDACYLYFGSGGQNVNYRIRNYGHSVRAVLSAIDDFEISPL